MKRTVLAAISITAAACAHAVGKGVPVQDVVVSLSEQDWLAYEVNASNRIPPDEWVELTPAEINPLRPFPNPFFAPLAQPFHEARPVHVAVHVGQIDVVRTRYAALGFQIELVETAVMSLLWVDPAPLPGPDQEARVREIISQLLPTKRPLFFFPSRQGEALRFSTSAEGSAHISGPARGVYYGGIGGSRLFLAYFYPDDRSASGDWKRDPSHWLRGAILDAWNARRPHPPAR